MWRATRGSVALSCPRRFLFVAVVLVGASCRAMAEQADLSASTGSVVAHSTVSSEPTASTGFEFSIPTGATRRYTFPALGGIRIDALDSHDVYAAGDRVMVDAVGGLGAFDSGAAYIGLATQGSDRRGIRTVEGLLSELDDVVAERTGEHIDLFGYRLLGYSVERREAEPRVFLPSVRFGVEGRHVWTLDRDLIFMATTPAGVLYAGYDTGGSPERPVGLGAFAVLVSSAELTGPGFDRALPLGRVDVAEGPRPEPAIVAEAGPDPLQIAHGGPLAGRYQIPNFGQQVSLAIDGWTVQPNQPGIVALTYANSVGPGDSSVVFISGLSASIVAQASGPRTVGEPIDLSDINAFLDEPPANLVISNVSDVEVAGLAAVRFDIRVGPAATCAQNEPCEYAFEPTWPWSFSVAIRAELAHRIWWFPDHPTGVAMIHASDLDEDFLDDASRLVASAEALD